MYSSGETTTSPSRRRSDFNNQHNLSCIGVLEIERSVLSVGGCGQPVNFYGIGQVPAAEKRPTLQLPVVRLDN